MSGPTTQALALVTVVEPKGQGLGGAADVNLSPTVLIEVLSCLVQQPLSPALGGRPRLRISNKGDDSHKGP